MPRGDQFKGITQVRNSFVRTMGRLFGRQAGRLVKRIRSKSPGSTFPSASKVSFKFFNQIEEEYQDLVRIKTTKIYREAAIAHGMPKDEANQRAREYAAHRSDVAANQLSGSAFDRFITLTRKLEKRIDNSSETSYTELRRMVMEVFNPARGQNVAINETTLAASEGAQQAVSNLGLTSRKDKWHNNPHLSKSGPCPICTPLHKKTRRVWEKKFPTGPPAHVRCVCSIKFANAKKIAAYVRRLKKL